MKASKIVLIIIILILLVGVIIEGVYLYNISQEDEEIYVYTDFIFNDTEDGYVYVEGKWVEDNPGKGQYSMGSLDCSREKMICEEILVQVNDNKLFLDDYTHTILNWNDQRITTVPLDWANNCVNESFILDRQNKKVTKNRNVKSGDNCVPYSILKNQYTLIKGITIDHE